MTDEAENVQVLPKHTPGPWVFYAPSSWTDGLGYIRPDPEDGLEIAHHGDDDRSAAENLANARLIAAAPDLLAELKRVTDHLSDWTSAHSMECTAEIDAALHCARAAIARATGGGA